MRTCGVCGESGHNARTCAKRGPVVTGPRSVVSYAESRPANTFELDEETLEALDWYMEKLHPGYLDRREARANARDAGVSEVEEDEHDAD